MMPPLALYKWKGLAIYYTVVASDRQALHVAWPELTPAFAPIRNYVALYPA